MKFQFTNEVFRKSRKQATKSRAQASKQVYKEIELLEDRLEDLKELETKLDSLIQSGYDPEIDDGVRVNIAPLQLNGLLAANVLSDSDAKKAIQDLKEWKKQD